MAFMHSQEGSDGYLRHLQLQVPIRGKFEQGALYKIESGCVRLCSRVHGKSITLCHLGAGAVFDVSDQIDYAEAVTCVRATKLVANAQIDGRLLWEATMRQRRNLIDEKTMSYLDVPEHLEAFHAYLSRLPLGQRGKPVVMSTHMLAQSINRSEPDVAWALIVLGREGHGLPRQALNVVFSPLP